MPESPTNPQSKSPTKRKGLYGSPSKPCVVSRHSGLRSDCGTFGKKPRFAKNELKGNEGKHSPWGEEYFAHSQSTPGFSRKAGIGFGSRPGYIRGMPNVGPATYTPVTSVAKWRSPLDGKNYCTTTMKIRTKVVVGAVSPHEEARKPGPIYDTREDMGKNGHGPKIGLPVNNHEEPVVGALYDTSIGMGHNRNQCKSTFGLAQRFDTEGKSRTSQSPDGFKYYSHSHQTNDYCKHAKACSMGSGEKTEWAKAAQTSAGPASYYPVPSASKCTSSLDGFTLRMLSPVTQFSGVKKQK